jgi:hypothetical protein
MRREESQPWPVTPGLLSLPRMQPAMMRKILCINSVIVVLLAAFFFIYPPIRAALDI